MVEGMLCHKHTSECRSRRCEGWLKLLLRDFWKGEHLKCHSPIGVDRGARGLRKQAGLDRLHLIASTLRDHDDKMIMMMRDLVFCTYLSLCMSLLHDRCNVVPAQMQCNASMIQSSPPQIPGMRDRVDILPKW